MVSDINMPNMNGFQLLGEIKKDDKLKHIPVPHGDGRGAQGRHCAGGQQGGGWLHRQTFTKATLEDKVNHILTKMGLK